MSRIASYLRRPPPRLCTAFITVVLTLACHACDGAPSPADTETAPATLPDDRAVLAEVNGTPITRYELQQVIEETLSKLEQHQLSKARRRAILEGLVEARAISQLQHAQMDEQALARLDKKVAAYRERELVRSYLRDHTKIVPVNELMIKKYYETHPEEFGGRLMRSYEMIATERALAPVQRDGLLRALAEPDSTKDWKAWSRRLIKAGYPVFYRGGKMNEGALHERLRTVMRGLGVGQASPVVMAEGRAYLVRVTGEERTEPRPLSEVAPDIRKRLAPKQMKRSAQEAAKAALAKTTVKYL